MNLYEYLMMAETCGIKCNEYMIFIVLCYSDSVVDIDLPKQRDDHT
jgi:hypothetical protein